MIMMIDSKDINDDSDSSKLACAFWDQAVYQVEYFYVTSCHGYSPRRTKKPSSKALDPRKHNFLKTS